MNNIEHPLTQDETKLIRSGDLVQLHNGKNTLWSQVADVKTRGYFDGVVSSRLPPKENAYNFGDLIRFHSRHIYNISRSDSLQYS
jgi:hypothetical protein